MPKNSKDNDTVYALKKKAEREIHLDAIRGSLIGGAAGDALGYPIEFMTLDQIKRKYGEKGILEYNLNTATGKALISDDTQMTLFTAAGIMEGDTRGCLRGIQGPPSEYVWNSYQAWLRTQQGERKASEYKTESWLDKVPELYANRAPGNTCLSALSQEIYGTIENPINNSKGCGGIMRVAPLGMYYDGIDPKILDKEGAAVAALTHGHPLGYMPASVMTHIINQIIYQRDHFDNLKDIVLEAKKVNAEIFEEEKYLAALNECIDLAVSLSENHDSDEQNIQRLGEGWVAEETLSIAIYCALRHSDDFSAGIIAAVNHSGDSDSTGAVTGNILGSWLGYDAIDAQWKENLELADLILEVADDLCQGCLMEEYSTYKDPAWESKYIYRNRCKDKKGEQQ